MSNPLENTAGENLAIILQQLVRETRELKEDNRKLREEVRGQLQLQDRQQKENRTDCDTRPRRRRRRTAPKDCQAAVRAVYKALTQLRSEEDEDLQFTGFALNERFDSPANRAVSQHLLQETIQDNGGENCEFTVPMIKLAVKRYFVSKKEDGKRESEGSLINHRTTCRKHQRLTMKQLNRTDALDTIDWTEERKEKWQTLLKTTDYMSSEESEEEAENDGQKRIVFKVKMLSWERKALKEGKKGLDEQYISKLSRRATLKRIKRVRGVHVSDRPRPEQPLRWAVRKESSNLTSNSGTSAASSSTVGAPLHASTPQHS